MLMGTIVGWHSAIPEMQGRTMLTADAFSAPEIAGYRQLLNFAQLGDQTPE